MTAGAIVFAGLMPHAPILVPGVGRERLADAAATARAMKLVAAHALAAQPDTIVLISPHSPRLPGSFGLWQSIRLRGSLEIFGAPEDTVDLPVDRSFASHLEQAAGRRGLHFWDISHGPLDHGALVPLWYLTAAGWKGPTVVLGLNDPGEGGLVELGQAIAETARGLKRRTAIIASGDMSHRLTRSAPCGFHPQAHRFDETFIGLLREDRPADIPRIDPDLQDVAAEDVVDATMVALAASGFHTEGHKVLSYEGPFGVGYGVAILFEPPHPADPVVPAGTPAEKKVAHFADLPAVARWAVETELRDIAPLPPFRAAGELTGRRGVFVTLRTKDGELRGCMGTLVPRERDLVAETWRNALAAALRDNRFSPVTVAELPNLDYEVTVLGELEPIESPVELDPAKYGVVVSALDGRKGVLLPAIEGIESVDQQLEIARHKAGLDPGEPVSLQRFEVIHCEPPPTRRGE
jgi:AmmeMemoRadiSam system protein A